MSLLRALLALAAALGLQVALGRIWPDVNRFVSLLLVLVAVYGVSGSQRSAMFVGCLAGLFHDVWLEAGAFGISGFKWTLLGWVLGSVAARLDLGNGPARFVAGACLVQFTTIGLMFSYGLFFNVFEVEFGWSRTLLSSCISLAFFVMGVLAVFAGRRPLRAGFKVAHEGAEAGFVTSGTSVPFSRFYGEGLTAVPSDEHDLRPIGLALIRSDLHYRTDRPVVLQVVDERGNSLDAELVGHLASRPLDRKRQDRIGRTI